MISFYFFAKFAIILLMAIIQTDPESIEKVAFAIDKGAKDIYNDLQYMKSSVNSMQWDWNDSVRRKFDEDFASLTAQMNNFMQAAPETVAYLRKKAAQLREYQQM